METEGASSAMAEPLLSICVPIYNQAQAFCVQVRSIAPVPSRVKAGTEIVIVDDCSTDDLAPALDQLRGAGWDLNLIRNAQNLGRAPSLAKAIRAARGRYVLIMDGDDPFIENGLKAIYDALIEFEASGHEDECLGMVFGTLIDDGTAVRRNALQDGLQCTLLALRADHGIKGDVKEVIKREAVLDALCDLFDRYRRVPTSLLWMRLSDRGSVRCSSKIVVRKSYQPGGLTRNLEVHRSANLPPLLALYQGIADSKSYKSLWYRLRAAINYHRFLARSGGGAMHLRSDFFWVAAVAGISTGLIERRRSRRRPSHGE
jgi:glycosyltransferase involved in cell wall biosynthesis